MMLSDITLLYMEQHLYRIYFSLILQFRIYKHAFFSFFSSI